MCVNFDNFYKYLMHYQEKKYNEKLFVDKNFFTDNVILCDFIQLLNSKKIKIINV